MRDWDGYPILTKLVNRRIFSLQRGERKGEFIITEACDQYFKQILTAEELIALAKEILAMVKGDEN